MFCRYLSRNTAGLCRCLCSDPCTLYIVHVYQRQDCQKISVAWKWVSLDFTSFCVALPFCMDSWIAKKQTSIGNQSVLPRHCWPLLESCGEYHWHRQWMQRSSGTQSKLCCCFYAVPQAERCCDSAVCSFICVHVSSGIWPTSHLVATCWQCWQWQGSKGAWRDEESSWEVSGNLAGVGWGVFLNALRCLAVAMEDLSNVHRHKTTCSYIIITPCTHLTNIKYAKNIKNCR